MSPQRITTGGFSLPLPGDHLPVAVLVDELATLHDQHSAHPDPGFLDDLVQEILRQGRCLHLNLGDNRPENRAPRLQRREGDPR